jgi:hypothetical protein
MWESNSDTKTGYAIVVFHMANNLSVFLRVFCPNGCLPCILNGKQAVFGSVALPSGAPGKLGKDQGCTHEGGWRWRLEAPKNRPRKCLKILCLEFKRSFIHVETIDLSKVQLEKLDPSEEETSQRGFAMHSKEIKAGIREKHTSM